MTTLTVGLAATKAPWSAALRSYVRDHTQGIAVEVIMDRAALQRAQSRIDVLVLDDVMRSFTAADVDRARASGAHVIGLLDDGAGMGHRYLVGLGVDQVARASTSPDELIAVIGQVRPRLAATPNPARGPSRTVAGPTAGTTTTKRGLVMGWTKVSGGSGLTETVVAAAEYLARAARALVIEAEEVTPVLVSRLRRSSEGGLPWALSRARQGLPALPEGLSGARDDGVPRLGRFDAMCAAPGAAQGASGGQLEKVVAEAASSYDYVLVEANWLTSVASARDRADAITSVWKSAACIVVVAAADPEGAARLVQWKAWAMAGGLVAPCWAVFGRAGKEGYERGQLQAVVEANTGRHPFAGFRFLPEDKAVARARWNAEIVGKGPWQTAVVHLVVSCLAGATSALAAGAPGRVPTAVAATNGKPTGAIAL